MSNVTLREITAQNIDLVGEIRVKPEQRYFVASVAKTFWQARNRKDIWMRAIYAGEEPVGFLALRDPSLDGARPPFEIYFARLIIDAAHQERGYGKEAIRLALEHARRRTGCASVLISHMPDNAQVGRLYESFGFGYTGTVDEDGEVEMRLVLGPAKP